MGSISQAATVEGYSVWALGFRLRFISLSSNLYCSSIKTSQSFRSDLCKTALSSLLGVSQAARRLVLRKSSSEIFVNF